MKAAAILLAVLLAGAAQAATIDVPGCATLAITGQTATTVTLACGQAPPPPAPTGPADYSACAQAGFGVLPYTLAWPVTGGVLLPTGPWNNAQAVVVKFTTPAAGKAHFQPTAYPPNQGVFKLYTVSTSPCRFATTNAAVGDIAYATVGGAPSVEAIVGKCPYPANLCPVFGAYLQPLTAYYVTMVNRGGFFGTVGYLPSCPIGDSCAMRLEFYSAN